MKAQLKVEFLDGQHLDINDCARWNQAASAFAHALTTDLVPFFPGIKAPNKILTEEFENTRTQGEMSIGHERTIVKLLGH